MSAQERDLLSTIDRRLRSERMLADISQAFLGKGDYEAAFETACRLLGEGTGVSRVYIFENFDNNSRCCNTVEWVNSGITPVKDELQDVSYDSLRYWRITLESGERICAHDISTLPREVVEILEWQGIKSVLVVPLVVIGRWHGFLGYDECTTERTWDDVDISNIETAARIISTAMEMRQLANEMAHTARLSAVGALAAGVAHEYNNLHAGILGLVELCLESPGLPDPLRRDLSRVLGLVHRAAGLTQKLLDLSRKRPHKVVPVDLSAAIEDCLSVLASSLKAEGVQVAVECSAPATWVAGDAAEIGQVILNIVLNALEAMHGRIEKRLNVVLWNTPAGQVSVSFEDTGSGIATDVLPRIFDPFFTTKGKLGGGVKESTGLGLSISQQIMRQQGGTLTAHNSPSGGAVFELTLPTVDARQRPEPAPAPVQPAAAPRVGRIGVLDDEDSVLSMLQRHLARQGHHVEVFGSTLDAMSACMERSFDVFLVDLVLPPPDGAEFLRFIQRLPSRRRPWAVVMSGRAPADLDDLLVGLPVAGVLPKPFADLDAVSREIRVVLERREETSDTED